MDLMAQRDKELVNIFQYGGYAFFGCYALASFGSILMKGRLPYFRTFTKHSILAGCGTYCSAMLSEKIAAEVWYNKLLIQLADKYNFTPEEVMDL